MMKIIPVLLLRYAEELLTNTEHFIKLILITSFQLFILSIQQYLHGYQCFLAQFSPLKTDKNLSYQINISPTKIENQNLQVKSFYLYGFFHNNINMPQNQKEKAAKPTLQIKGAYKQYNFYENNNQCVATIGGQYNNFLNNPYIDRLSLDNQNFQKIQSPKFDQKIQKDIDQELNNMICRKKQEKQEQDDVIINCEPLFYDIDEVDHNIEQIGLMAVRQVRYVDDDEWQEMLRQQKKYAQAIKQNIMEDVRKTRKIEAKKRSRNQRGQFLPKSCQSKKQKPIKKSKNSSTNNSHQIKQKSDKHQKKTSSEKQ